jgi:enamine deaminase RidA (YjgF/YER057c/UK114 family)
MVTFANPATVHTPAGNYTHTAIVPTGTELVFISGQVANRPDGTIPATFAEQAEVVFANLRSCLAAHGLEMKSVVKLNAYLVAGQDVHAMREVRLRHFGAHKPTSTAVFVPALVSPELLLEVEAIAAKISRNCGV